MKLRTILWLGLVGSGLAGCTFFGDLVCSPHCRSETRNSSSLVNFLYPDGNLPPPQDAIPELHLPLRVGLAFLPSQYPTSSADLDDAHKEQILERIRKRFADRKFVSEIVIIPDYYLKSSRGFDGLQGVLASRFKAARDIRYSMKYVAVRPTCAALEPGCQAKVEVLIDASYTITDSRGQARRLDKRDQNMLVLEYTGDKWLFLSGM